MGEWGTLASLAKLSEVSCQNGVSGRNDQTQLRTEYPSG